MVINLGSGGTVINPFDKTDIDPSESLDDIVNSNTDTNISEKDNIEYEVKNENVLQISSNGTMIPKEDGTTQVDVKLNGENIGLLDVEVENGEVKKITSPGSTEENDSTQDNEIDTTIEKEKRKSVTESGKKVSPLILVFVLIVIILMVIIFYSKKNNKKKNRRKKTKKEKKDGKIY